MTAAIIDARGRIVVYAKGIELFDALLRQTRQISTGALQSAGDAADSAAIAQLAETAAVAAAGGPYPDTATGLAATAANGYFTVAGNGTNTYAILYRKVSGAAAEIAQYPSKAAYEGPTGAGLIGFKQSGSGAITRAVESKLRDLFVSIEEFYDAVQDDGDYIWALGRAITAGHTRIFFPVKLAGYDFIASITRALTRDIIIDFNGQVTRFHYTPGQHARVTLTGTYIVENRALAANIATRYATSMTLAAGTGVPLPGDLMFIETSQAPLASVPDTKQDCVPIASVTGGTVLKLSEGLNFTYATSDPGLKIRITRPVSLTMLRPHIQIVSNDAQELADGPTHLAFRLIGLRDVRIIEPVIKGTYPFTRDNNVFRNGIWVEDCWGVLIDTPYYEAMSYAFGVYGGTRKIFERNVTARYCHHSCADCGEFSADYQLSGLNSSDSFQALMTHPVFRAYAENFDVRNDYGLSGWRCIGGGLRNGKLESSVDDTAELPQFQSFTANSGFSYIYGDADFHAVNVEFIVPNRPNKTPFGPRYGRTAYVANIKSVNSMLAGFGPGELGLLVTGPGNQLGATGAGAPSAGLISATTVRADAPPGRTASVASASALALPIGFEVVEVTGTTTVTSIASSGHAGRRVTLIFGGVLTFTDGGNLRLSANLVTSADDTITLVCNGTNWYEVGRSVN